MLELRFVNITPSEQSLKDKLGVKPKKKHGYQSSVKGEKSAIINMK